MLAVAQLRAARPAVRAMIVYRWRIRTKLPERHGQLCRVVARGRMNSILVEFFEDGWKVVTSRFAVLALRVGDRLAPSRPANFPRTPGIVFTLREIIEFDHGHPPLLCVGKAMPLFGPGRFRWAGKGRA